MREQLQARIAQMANEIAQRWESEGQPIRPYGTRDGDNDRCDMGDEIWATLTESISLGEDPDIISETLTEWHKARE